MQSTNTNLDALAIRRARIDDVERLWFWRNDPDTRRASHNTEYIELDHHTRWFKSAMARDESIMLIAELHGEPIGTVRFDKRADSFLEVSINIAPQARAKKLGAACLREACNFVLAKGPAGFHAAIRPDNAASIRIFQQCGFHDFGREDGFLLLRRHPDKQPGLISGSPSGEV